jgi:eukaryotic-like serine/threonine-protein kinase
MAAIIPPEATGAPDVIPGRRHPEHYELRARLGEGGFGEVYEAWDTRLQRSVAIKTIRHGDSAVVDLVREARLAASLRHAAFVKVHAVEDDGNGQFIVMELVHGRTLKQILQDGPVQLSTALDWVRQVAKAMRDAHASGLVHGDIKPSNLMVENDGRVRILDFGLALRQDTLETETVSIGATASTGQADPRGTIAYMAPERLQGAPPDPRADVYALGVILYELTCGKRPFATLHGLALAAALVQTSSDVWDYPDGLDTPLIALIRGMTARQPGQRIEYMNDVVLRLSETGRYQLPITTTTSAPQRRPILRAAMIVCGLLLTTVPIGVALWHVGPNLRSVQNSMQNPLAPYSEAEEMEKGLAALKLFDRPGSLESAQHRFERILAHTPENAASVAGLSLVYNIRYGSDRQDETWLQKADAGAQQALKLNDQLAIGHVAVAAVRESQGRFDEALAACERALRLDPNNYFAWYFKSETLRQARHFAEARATLAEAMRRFPRERVFLDELGSLEYEQGNDAAAERAFRRSIALEPDAVMAYANLNATLLRQNRSDEALRVLQQGLQVRPSAKLYGNLGNALFLRGDYVGAAAAFQDAVSPTHGAPGNYLNWANLGDALRWLPGQEKQARQAYDKARQLIAPRLQRAPDDVLLVSRMGVYAARAGRRNEALELMRRAVALAPGSADVQFRAGLAYELLGERALALTSINTARRLGYPKSFIEAEPDLVSLRRDPGYQGN